MDPLTALSYFTFLPNPNLSPLFSHPLPFTQSFTRGPVIELCWWHNQILETGSYYVILITWDICHPPYSQSPKPMHFSTNYLDFFNKCLWRKVCSNENWFYFLNNPFRLLMLFHFWLILFIGICPHHFKYFCLKPSSE